MDKIEALEIHSIENNRATVVSLTYVIPNTAVITSTGASVRHPEDRHDPELAYELALARALASLSRKIDRHAWGRIRNNDHANQARKARKTQVAKAVSAHPTLASVRSKQLTTV